MAGVISLCLAIGRILSGTGFLASFHEDNHKEDQYRSIHVNTQIKDVNSVLFCVQGGTRYYREPNTGETARGQAES
jgi:hypothetical protein